MIPTLDLCRKGAILQQVNCQNAYGIGLSGAISSRYPLVETSYHQHCVNSINNHYSPVHLLGGLQGLRVSDNVLVFNSFTQLYYGNSYRTGVKYTDENKLINNIKLFDKYVKTNKISGYVPKLMGCGLAGGNPDTILEELQDTDLIVVEYN